MCLLRQECSKIAEGICIRRVMEYSRIVLIRCPLDVAPLMAKEVSQAAQCVCIAGRALNRPSVQILRLVKQPSLLAEKVGEIGEGADVMRITGNCFPKDFFRALCSGLVSLI